MKRPKPRSHTPYLQYESSTPNQPVKKTETKPVSPTKTANSSRQSYNPPAGRVEAETKGTFSGNPPPPSAAPHHSPHPCRRRRFFAGTSKSRKASCSPRTARHRHCRRRRPGKAPAFDGGSKGKEPRRWRGGGRRRRGERRWRMRRRPWPEPADGLAPVLAGLWHVLGWSGGERRGRKGTTVRHRGRSQ